MARYRRHRRRRYNPDESYSNPRRRYRRRRSNPFGIGGGRAPFGINVEDSAGVVAGAIGTSYLDSAVVGPFLGPMLKGLGHWQPAVQAVFATIAAHFIADKFLRKWSRVLSPGANVYAAVGVANTVAPGLVPITIGVPKQLQNLHLFAALQPPSTTGAAALPAGTSAGITTQGQTLGRRIQAPNGL